MKRVLKLGRLASMVRLEAVLFVALDAKIAEMEDVHTERCLKCKQKFPRLSVGVVVTHVGLLGPVWSNDIWRVTVACGHGGSFSVHMSKRCNCSVARERLSCKVMMVDSGGKKIRVSYFRLAFHIW